MRLLLDAKDLIELVERNFPMAMNDLAHWLSQRSARLVLTATNVAELVAPLKVGRDFLEVRPWLQELERSPVCYLRETYIILQELQSAVEAFRDGTEFWAPDPYVVRWDEAIQAPGKSVAKIYVNYRLDEMIYTLSKGNSLFNFAPATQKLNAVFQADRSIPKESRLSLKQNFIETVKRFLKLYGLATVDADRLGTWIYNDPGRCPGLRFGYEAFHALEQDRSASALLGDIPDFAHIRAIPYVDCVTLDRRMAHYCRGVSRRLRMSNPALDYETRIFDDLQNVIGAFPEES